MAKACGIRLGRRRFELVALEGSAKSPRITTCVVGEIAADPSDPDGWRDAAVEELKAAGKDLGVDPESIALSVDTGLAAFRTLKLPFADRAKIEQVIKFEVESDLPQWDIDDVIVDWHVLRSTPVESEVLVTSVPKEALRPAIDACERAGVEPLDAELEATAVFEAAVQSGATTEDGTQILVYVGESTTSVIAVDGGRLRGIRAVHIGGLDPVATAPEGSGAAEEGGDDDVDLPGFLDEDPGAEPAAAASHRDLEASTRRLRREIGRTIAAGKFEHPVDAILVCGFPLPGLADESVLDVPVKVLDVLPAGADREVVPPGSEGRVAAAYGSALRMLGGAQLKPSLRREELYYAGKFERLELPLAVFSLLLVTLLGVHLIVTQQQILFRGEGVLTAGEDGLPRPGDLQLWLESSNNFMFDDLEANSAGRLTNPPKKIKDYALAAERGEDQYGRSKYEQIVHIRTLLNDEIKRIQVELGQTGEIKQPMSALTGMTQVLATLDANADAVGRYSIRSLKAVTTGGTARTDEHILLTLDMTFFAEDGVVATNNYTQFRNAIEAERWCLEFERKPTKVLDDGKGISVDGMRIKVDASLVEVGP